MGSSTNNANVPKGKATKIITQGSPIARPDSPPLSSGRGHQQHQNVSSADSIASSSNRIPSSFKGLPASSKSLSSPSKGLKKSQTFVDKDRTVTRPSDKTALTQKHNDLFTNPLLFATGSHGAKQRPKIPTDLSIRDGHWPDLEEESSRPPSEEPQTQPRQSMKRKRTELTTPSSPLGSSEDEDNDPAQPSTPVHKKSKRNAPNIRHMQDGTGFAALDELPDLQDGKPANAYLLTLLGMVPGHSGNPPPMSTIEIAKLYKEKEHTKFTHRYKRAMEKAYGTGCAKEYARLSKVAKSTKSARQPSEILEDAIKAIGGNSDVPKSTLHKPRKHAKSRSVCSRHPDIDKDEDAENGPSSSKGPETPRPRKRRRANVTARANHIPQPDEWQLDEPEFEELPPENPQADQEVQGHSTWNEAFVYVPPADVFVTYADPNTSLLTHEEANQVTLDALASHRARTRLLDDTFGEEDLPNQSSVTRAPGSLWNDLNVASEYPSAASEMLEESLGDGEVDPWAEREKEDEETARIAADPKHYNKFITADDWKIWEENNECK